MYVIKDQLDYFEEKLAKIIQIFLSKKVRSGCIRILKTATGFSQGINTQSQILIQFGLFADE
jgi:hypothetical protein